MKTFEDIPYEKYNDTKYCYDYLNFHKTMGNEDTEYNGIFHVHWRGPIDNNKVILQLKSTLATQEVDKIFFWIESELITKFSLNYINLNQLHKKIEVKTFDKSVFDQATGNSKNKERIWMFYTGFHGDRRYKTDMLRWIILNIYGGVYTDADTFLLRDVRDIKIKNWSSKWGVEPYAEGCIIKLEKGSDVYEQMYLNNPTNSQCFLLIQNYMPEAFNFKYENLNFTSLPSSFFDIVWNESDKDVPYLNFNNFDYFFKETDKEVTLDNFMKGCFAYHWHNRWTEPELQNSFAGKLNQHLDKIIENKYNIKPYKIFNT
jgi:hypothetical protein